MISKRRLDYLIRLSEKQSLRSNYKATRKKVGCVIFKGSKVLSTGYNKSKSHPLAKKFFKFGTIHAEIDAILKSDNKQDLEGGHIFIFRCHKNGSASMARPCPLCIQVLYQHKIKVAIWTTPEFPYWQHDTLENLIQLVDKKQSYETNRHKEN